MLAAGVYHAPAVSHHTRTRGRLARPRSVVYANNIINSEGREEKEGEPETATPLAIHPFDSFRVGGKTSDRAGGTVAGVGDFGVAADLRRDDA